LRIAIAPGAYEQEGDKMKVSEIMTKHPAYVTLETSLHDVAQLMVEHDCGSLPVLETEEDLTPVGIITDRDITIRTVAHNKNPLHMIAGEVMTEGVITVTPDSSVEECLVVMEKNQVRRILVVDGSRNICGIVAQADIARKGSASDTAELVKDLSMSATA
jgi:CBS domain-containing protein